LGDALNEKITQDPGSKNRGRGALLRRELQGAASFVFYEKAGVFDYQEAGGAGSFCGGEVGDPLLEPERFGVDGDGGIGDRRNLFGAAENIDNVDGARGVFETGIGFFAEDFGFVGVDGDDFVPGGLEVGGDFVGRARGIGGEADYGDGFGGAHKVANWIGGGGGVVWEMDEHLY
jgi:hypothetical protein